jgi:hypothetical protein
LWDLDRVSLPASDSEDVTVPGVNLKIKASLAGAVIFREDPVVACGIFLNNSRIV